MSSHRKVVAAVIFTIFAVGFVTGLNKYNSNTIPLLGGWNDAKEDDKSMLKALQFATEEYNKGNNGNYIVKVVKINRFRKQVVSGMNYSMNVDVLTTPCRDFESTSENCRTQKKTCSFMVRTVAWRNIQELTSHSCY
ncbi:hypothetical protein XENTR_v10013622 [Xenopus tropicalis]|uniref:Cystatin-like n=1 Tax=Xenopus tropicalis TaxID=8364 RepID=A0A803JCU4_XENTR|nr:cystatin-like [Xenopus tropicalis]KAE8601299.1 hypothetical protein XENTR_v10013622 [Xenopus tropicalis]|eukprot:XP_004914734.1 PREDICTED: cystatin-like [Xenopus tropicalis]